MYGGCIAIGYSARRAKCRWLINRYHVPSKALEWNRVDTHLRRMSGLRARQAAARHSGETLSGPEPTREAGYHVITCGVIGDFPLYVKCSLVLPLLIIESTANDATAL